MKAFQCSKCNLLLENDVDDTCFCAIGIDPRPKHRFDGDRETCVEGFKPVAVEWHEPFYWEK